MLGAHMLHLQKIWLVSNFSIALFDILDFIWEMFDPTHHSILAVNGHTAHTAVKHLRLILWITNISKQEWLLCWWGLRFVCCFEWLWVNKIWWRKCSSWSKSNLNCSSIFHLSFVKIQPELLLHFPATASLTPGSFPSEESPDENNGDGNIATREI